MCVTVFAFFGDQVIRENPASRGTETTYFTYPRGGRGALSARGGWAERGEGGRGRGGGHRGAGV